MDKFLRLKIKTKLTFGIGLLFTMIVLLGGLAVQNITDMSSDTQNIFASLFSPDAGCSRTDQERSAGTCGV